MSVRLALSCVLSSASMIPDGFDACARLQAAAMPDPSAWVADATVTCASTPVCIRSACDLDSDGSSDDSTSGSCSGGTRN